MDKNIKHSLTYTEFFKKNLGLVLLFMLTSWGIQAQIIHITDNRREYAFSGEISYLEDSTHALTISDVSFNPRWNNLFNSQIPDEYSNNASVFWAKFTIINTSVYPVVLDTHMPLLWAVMYYPKLDSTFYADTCGIWHKPSQRMISYTNETFNIPYSEEPITYYLKFRKLDPKAVYFGIKSMEHYTAHSKKINLISGIVFGVICIIVFYCIVLFVRLKVEFYLFLALFIISFGLFELKDLGFINQFLWLFSIDWNSYLMLYNVPYSFCTIFLILFVNNGLKLNRYLPVFYYMNLAMVFLKLFFVFAGNIQFDLLRSPVFDALFTVPSLISTLYMAYKKGNESLFFLFSLLCIFSGMVVKVLPDFVQLSQMDWVGYYYAGSTITGIALFSTMLSYKVRRLENYKVQAKEKLILKLKENEKLRDRVATELEMRVKERTYELEEKNKQLDLFVYKSTHDIRGPLKSIIGLTNIAEKEIQPEPLQKYISLIKTCALSLDHTVTDLLEIGKINHLKDYEKEPIIFQKMIEDIQLELFAGRTSNFEIRLNIKPNLILYSVRPLINSIFQNLIENAFKYRDVTKSNSFLEILIYTEGNFTIIKFRDNGIGMDEDTMDRIFEMFYRHQNDKSGSGLGLYIVKLSLLKLGGDVTVESEPGKGTTFTIKLPDING